MSETSHTPPNDGTRVDQALEDALRRHRPAALSESLRARIAGATHFNAAAQRRTTATVVRQWSIAAVIAIMAGLAGLIAGLAVGRQQGFALAHATQPQVDSLAANWSPEVSSPTSAGRLRTALSTDSLDAALESASRSLPEGSAPTDHPLSP